MAGKKRPGSRRLVKRTARGRAKGRRRMEPTVVAEEAARYGIRVPVTLPPSERFISPNEAGRILNVTGEAVKQWIYHRLLPALKLSNGYWKIKVSDLEDFIRARQNPGKRRILIVERSGAAANQIVGAIEESGHQAVVAHNASDALLKAADQYPSLFIVNVTFSQFDAWKLLEKIRKTRNIKNAPILIIADRDLKEAESDKALRLGTQGFMRTPIKPPDLLAEIDKILSRIL